MCLTHNKQDGTEANSWAILGKRSFNTELHTYLSTEAQTRMEVHPRRKVEAMTKHLNGLRCEEVERSSGRYLTAEMSVIAHIGTLH